MLLQRIKGSGRDDSGLTEATPNRRLNLLARAMNGFRPARQDPTGAPRAFEKQTLAVSNDAEYCASEIPVFAESLN